MKRYAATIELIDEPEKIESYLTHHQAVWAEVMLSFKAVGVLDLRIWRFGARLFYELETTDEFVPERDFARYASMHPSNPIWESFMTTFQAPLKDRKAGEHRAAMDLAFDFAAQTRAWESGVGLKIDSHQHFWNYSTEEYAWIDDSMSRIAKTFEPEDLQPLLSGAGLHGCIAVQARCEEKENHYLLNLAKKHPFVMGVVGWVDLQSPDVEQKLLAYQHEKTLVGFREILQGKPNEFFLNDAFYRGLGCLHQHGYSYDILLFANQLDAARELLRHTHPEQRLVLDHLCKPDIKNQGFESWSEGIQILADENPNLHCKLSGMVTEADLKHWKASDILPYLETAIEAFGVDRVMFGSDWPVCLLAAEDYSQVHRLVADHVAQLGADAEAKILGANAMKFYQLPLPRLSEQPCQ